MPFDLASVVTLAQDAGFRHIPHNIASSVGIFRYPETEWQVTVYYTTQTVATSVGHPLKRKSQLFRQNVTWTELAQIFEYPKSHISKSLHRTTLAHNNSKEEDIIEHDIEEESAIRSHLKNLEFQVRECQALLQTVLLKKQKEAEMKRKAEEQRWRIEEAAAKKARMEAEVRMEKLNKRGNKCIWSLKYDRDFPDMDDTVCVENGKTYWDLGDDEYNQAFTDEYHSEGVEFVAFGSCDSFVIQFWMGVCRGIVYRKGFQVC
ncbi:hypothetical protein BCR33DRAFT_771114 [Rhizoclosmatium globosum]|uniref:Uncharacterized protein n=1 Tax=Rhizoclosmatium globosum TaxID=329046 RepID=A0A1Y2BGI0_9FUNG|nr:hypothetical protein BCR33DRAFT_771114 [Rhizoclosmatium globosum]|eukprot:ORY33919.1 hypothetical protein BCR33DRAFT_771114 [Rhizoclosmatium globosum]